MSIPVPIDELPARIADRRSGFVITTSSNGHPHVAHQPISWDPETASITFPAGASTTANLAAMPQACLLFPGTDGADNPDEGYSLIVDIEAAPTQSSGERVVVRPTHAVLHRPAPS